MKNKKFNKVKTGNSGKGQPKTQGNCTGVVQTKPKIKVVNERKTVSFYEALVEHMKDKVRILVVKKTLGDRGKYSLTTICGSRPTDTNDHDPISTNVRETGLSRSFMYTYGWTYTCVKTHTDRDVVLFVLKCHYKGSD